MFSILLISLVVGNVTTIPIQNAILGNVQVECDSRTISIQIKTERPFVGTVFVKDFASDRVCSSRGTGKLSAFLNFEIGLCGAFRQRILNPKGAVVRTTITISFHPYFITKVDRTYHIVCLYKEAEATVSNDISVDDIATVTATRNLTMPVCTYQILEGGPAGEPVQFGIIGQQVYHRWKCETASEASLCMLVHTCSADDGKGDRAFLIDSNGCAIDRFLLSNIEYPENLLAGQEAHVYKFADRDALFFQCQISITVKEPGEECLRPVCSPDTTDKPEGAGAPPVGSSPGPYDSSKKSQARSKRGVFGKNENVVDVRTRLSTITMYSRQFGALKSDINFNGLTEPSFLDSSRRFP
ncbi:unnamed protein product [Caenorhabditis sp. 36 PRJEB53466]|nr:unnamed protein product [Caenorhabditis sp. 36 PRJEB53466]